MRANVTFNVNDDAAFEELMKAFEKGGPAEMVNKARELPTVEVEDLSDFADELGGRGRMMRKVFKATTMFMLLSSVVGIAFMLFVMAYGAAHDFPTYASRYINGLSFILMGWNFLTTLPAALWLWLPWQRGEG